MLRIITKLYLQNFPYSLLLLVQLVLVAFIFNISFVMTTSDWQMLKNVNMPKGEFYLATGKEIEGVDLKKLKELLGEERVGYIERNGNKCIDGVDTIKSPGVVYLGGALTKISYELSDGKWFGETEHEVILGGDIASRYKIGDTLVISEGNMKEEAVVIGILKSPVREPNFDSTYINDFSALLWEKDSVLLTNDEDLVQGESTFYKVQQQSCFLNLSNTKKEIVTQIKEDYEICLVQDALEHAKAEQKVRTAKETFQLTILIAIAFVSVAIQIFLYVQKYKKELNVFRMLGMSWCGIYAITMFGHICNIGIGALGMYILFQSKRILAKFDFKADAGLTKSGWYATAVFFATYLVITALVFGLVVYKEEKRKEECYVY